MRQSMKLVRFVLVFSFFLFPFSLGCSGSASQRVVLYCAQDREFAEEILPEFTKQTGLKVDPKYDTEAGKSIMLFEELLREEDRPRCDVHWNNEILETVRLERQRVLEPYDSPAAAAYPASCMGKNDTWHAFAERARVLLVNTNLVPEAERPRSLLELTQPRWKGKVAMAKPEAGTTATQAACHCARLSAHEAK